MTYNPNTFCAGPYVELRINPDGSLNFCHASYNKNMPAEDHISQVTVDEYFTNSNTIKEVRHTLDQGGAVSKCNGCYTTEKLNIVSFRNRRNLQYGIFPGKDFDQSLKESSFWQNKDSKPTLKFYHVSLSNLCNMACLMCDPNFSSLLTTTLKQAKLIDNNVPILKDWTQGPAWDQFCEHLCSNDEIVCLHIMGGEPLYHKRFKELLILLNQRKHTNFSFTFVTNGSVYDPEIVSLLKNFKSVAVEISIEGVTDANDYIRHGGNTKTVLDNISKWSAHRSATFDVVLRSVPQALSVIHYDQLLDFALANKLLIDSNLLHQPNYLKANILPESIKQQIRDKLSRFVTEPITFDINDVNLRNVNHITRALQHNATAVLAQLDTPAPNVQLLQKQSVDYCSQYDRSRKVNIKNYIPELLEFMNQYNYEHNISSY